MSNKLFISVAVSIPAFILIGCAEPEAKSLSSSSSATTTTLPGAPTVSASTPLALKVSTKYDQHSETLKVTFVETGTDTCSASTGSPNPTCTVNIPEGRLYYSSVILTFSWATTSCPLMTFAPYYYQASNTANFKPPDLPAGSAASVSYDCSVVSPELPSTNCYGGPARDLVPSFPTKDRLIYLPDESQPTAITSDKLTIASAFSKNWKSNRWTSNSLVDTVTARTSVALGNLGDGYVSSTLQDYKWSCQDQWADLQTYTLTLKINDVNTSAAGANEFLTWQGF